MLKIKTGLFPLTHKITKEWLKVFSLFHVFYMVSTNWLLSLYMNIVSKLFYLPPPSSEITKFKNHNEFFSNSAMTSAQHSKPIGEKPDQHHPFLSWNRNPSDHFLFSFILPQELSLLTNTNEHLKDRDKIFKWMDTAIPVNFLNKA